MEDWRVGEIAVATPKGRTTAIAGWVKGPFGLDFRAFDFSGDQDWTGGWVLTHIATGYVVRRIDGSLLEAMQFADKLLSADWSFSDPASAKTLSAVVKAAMDSTANVGFYGQVSREIGPMPPVLS